jgi:DNA-binding transcriptional LysR family regulator
VPLEALNGETLLFSEVDCAYRRSFEQILDQKRIRPGAVLEFSSTAAIKQSVRAGIGITVLPQIAVAEELARGELCLLACADGRMEVAQMMVWYREKWLSPALTAFMAVTRDVVARQTRGALTA